MITNLISSLIAECCWYAPGDEPLCDEPIRYLALTTNTPNPVKAGIGGYCSREHANAEPRPTRRDAEHVYLEVVDSDGCMSEKDYDDALTAWQRLLEVFPNPVPVDMDA